MLHEAVRRASPLLQTQARVLSLVGAYAASPPGFCLCFQAPRCPRNTLAVRFFPFLGDCAVNTLWWWSRQGPAMESLILTLSELSFLLWESWIPCLCLQKGPESQNHCIEAPWTQWSSVYIWQLIIMMGNTVNSYYYNKKQKIYANLQMPVSWIFSKFKDREWWKVVTHSNFLCCSTSELWLKVMVSWSFQER